MKTPWEYANDSPVWLRPRRTVYFVVRHYDNEVEYRNDKRGRLITYRTREQAIAMVDKLNRRAQTTANKEH